MPHDATNPAAVAAREALITGKPPRIAPLESNEYGSEGLEIVNTLRKALSLPPSEEVAEYMATMLRHPGVLRRQVEMGLEFFAGALPVRDSELAVLRTGWLLQAPYIFGQHVQTAKRLCGLTSEDIDRIKAGSTAPGWNEHDRAVLRAAEELHDNAMISDETWAVLARTYDEKQLLELPAVVGHFHAVAFIQNSGRFRLMPGNPGLSSR